MPIEPGRYQIVTVDGVEYLVTITRQQAEDLQRRIRIIRHDLKKIRSLVYLGP